MRDNLRRCAMTIFLACCGVLFASDSQIATENLDSSLTPVSGESWLNHLHRSFGDTSMGKTGRLGPPPPPPGAETPRWQLGLSPSSDPKTLIRGSDLYRLNCQGCHGEAGLGVPPEIKSVIDPVRGTSVPIVIKRMRDRGADISATAAAELAKEAQGALLQRLHQGGQNMPAFTHLNEEEIRALIAYLKRLSDVPGTAQITITEPSIRVGEHIVKSTCHICHDATGPNPTPEQLENGAIPPLEALTRRTDELEFIGKVTSGAPILMGSPPTLHRGRMPVFYYITPSEAADAYLYLVSYPPSGLALASLTMTGMTQGQGPSSPDSSMSVPEVQETVGGSSEQLYGSSKSGITDSAAVIAVVGVGGFTFLLILGGLGFAIAEMIRLGHDAECRNARAANLRQAQSAMTKQVDEQQLEVSTAKRRRQA